MKVPNEPNMKVPNEPKMKLPNEPNMEGSTGAQPHPTCNKSDKT